MDLPESISKQLTALGLAEPQVELLDNNFKEMVAGKWPVRSVVMADMLRAAHDMRGFEDRFELLCRDFLESKPNIQMLKHQIEGAETVFTRMNLRAIIADEVGTGKTIEAGIIAKELQTRGMLNSMLVLAPKTIVPQWIDEMQEKFDMELLHVKEHAEAKLRKHPFWIAGSRSWYTQANSYYRNEILKRDWDLVIIDEAHYLKNHKTKFYRSILPEDPEEPALRNRFMLLLTATPIQNSLLEIFSLIQLVRPGAFGTLGQFKRQFFADTWGREPKDTRRLRQLVQENMLRRRRIECGIDFTNRRPKIHSLEFPKKLENAYQEILEFDTHIFTKMNWLRSASSSVACLRESLAKHPSLAYSPGLKDLWRNLNDVEGREPKIVQLRDIVAEEKSAVVFTEFVPTLKSIEKVMTQQHDTLVHVLHGGMNLEERRQSIREFRDKGGLFVSSPAGAEGVNLQFCSTVVNYDLPWNPMRVEQRIGRVHRLGQKELVKIHTLAYRGTIEDFILASLYKKLDLFKMSVGEIDDILTAAGDEEEFDIESEIHGLLSKGASLENIRSRLEQVAEERKRSMATQGGGRSLMNQVLN
jgi:SNF2 family DNA or RNA helicase